MRSKNFWPAAPLEYRSREAARYSVVERLPPGVPLDCTPLEAPVHSVAESSSAAAPMDCSSFEVEGHSAAERLSPGASLDCASLEALTHSAVFGTVLRGGELLFRGKGIPARDAAELHFPLRRRCAPQWTAERPRRRRAAFCRKAAACSTVDCRAPAAPPDCFSSEVATLAAERISPTAPPDRVLSNAQGATRGAAGLLERQ